ncbi:YjbE family putative metal transport protein [Candidatus Gracilibacteria bacterium]|nr:YjbE family putative metal transport protein [Candidatus Gracilibacteria bacterium]
MQNLTQEFAHLLTVPGLLALVNIIIIDIVMSGDNAIVIGMATRNLTGKTRKKAIFVGIALATVMRICFAFFATYLLTVTGLRFAGGILLLYVVWKFYKELRTGEAHHEEGNKLKEIGFWSAIYTIIIADVSMSLDNVLAVAGASHGNVVTLGIGLVFSIMLMAFASNYIAKKLNDYPIIQWIGLLVILFVAIEMLIKGTPDIENTIKVDNLFPFFIFMASSFFVILHQKYFTAISELQVKNFINNNFLKIIISFLLLILLFVNLGETIVGYINHHIAFLYFINLIILFLFLEVIGILKSKRK